MAMAWQEMLALQIQAQESQRKTEERRKEALGDYRKLQEMLTVEIGRFLLSTENPVDTRIFQDDTLLREAISERLSGTPWDDTTRMRAVDSAALRFRAMLSVLINFTLDWISAEREACAKIADAVAEDPHGSNPSCAAGEAIAAAIRERGR